jgi:biotin transport system substrate-specific component
MSISTELLWALVGLLLTIGGTFLDAFVAIPIWNSSVQGLQAHALGVTYQVGAVLLVGCLGGRNAAALSQIAYLLLGLVWLPVFAKGGGIGYLQEPTFGYLLGFVPAAWICGYLAFKAPPQLESLALSSFCGLISLHSVGIAYLTIAQSIGWVKTAGIPLQTAINLYSVYPLPGQLAVACAVTVIAFALRHVMFY